MGWEEGPVPNQQSPIIKLRMKKEVCFSGSIQKHVF
jgi:hypothetical protein